MSNYIIEVANCHGGDIDYLFSLINEFERFDGHGIKFQPLAPGKIATPDFEWFPVYEKLYFSPDNWKAIITEASKTKMVWLDLFDTYGTEILIQNKREIAGIKLQSSILYNYEVLNALSEIDCSNLMLIVNISGIELDSITERLKYFYEKIKPKEILLEVGFQAYPTKLADSGLNKILILKSKFSNRIVFADHIEGKLEDAIRLPLIAHLMGADVIEKHVFHSTLPTEYDHFSAIDHERYEEFTEAVEVYHSLSERPFINHKEIKYLENSIQVPITNKTLKRGQGVSLLQDFSFRRSGKKGLSVKEIEDLIQEFHILNSDVDRDKPLQKEHFKKATIGTIIAGRLKSSRLKRKAVLKIGNLPSIERCIKNTLDFNHVNHTVLATSDNEEDKELENFTFADGVLFYTGHPEDVMQRYLKVVEDLKIDVFIRVTADMPYVSEEIVDILLKSHFQSGADYTAAKEASVGTSVEIINTQALKKVKEYFPSANYSEYMTWYFRNNLDHFKINFVELPQEMVRDYRLTLDYEEDLKMFNELQSKLDEKNLEGTLQNVFQVLDNHPEIARINNHISLTYKTDKSLIETLNRETRIS